MTIEGSKPASSALAASVAMNSTSSPYDAELLSTVRSLCGGVLSLGKCVLLDRSKGCVKLVFPEGGSMDSSQSSFGAIVVYSRF